jgi:hypothetical protein
MQSGIVKSDRQTFAAIRFRAWRCAPEHGRWLRVDSQRSGEWLPMRSVLRMLFLGATVVSFSQQTMPPPSRVDSTMIAAVSRNAAMFAGGVGPGERTGRGTIAIEPIAQLTSSGEWVRLPCDARHPNGCRKFGRTYLSKKHQYTVVSGDGYGATVHAAPATLSECFSYVGPRTYAGANIKQSAIAASSTDLFSDSPLLHHVGIAESKPALQALQAFVPKSLDSVAHLQLFSVQLDGQDVVVVQRTFSDIAGKDESLNLTFVIGVVEKGRFRILRGRWNPNHGDEDEQVLGTIRLKSGGDFLITSVSDPESQWFRIYGIRGGKVTLVYCGGGSSC